MAGKVEKTGKTFRILREAKGYSMSDMARRAGISTPYLSLVEKGAREPSLGVLRRMSETLGLPAEALLQILSATTENPPSPKPTGDISRAIQQLIDVEDKLRSLLAKTEAGIGPEPGKARGRREVDGPE